MPKLKNQRSSEQKVSPFWKPEEGETLTGVFTYFTETKGYNEGEKGIGMSVGGKIVGLNTQLIRAIKPLIKTLKPGKTKISITFLEQTHKGKMKFNNYALAIDGKNIETNSFPKLMPQDSLQLLKEVERTMAKNSPGKKKK